MVTKQQLKMKFFSFKTQQIKKTNGQNKENKRAQAKEGGLDMPERIGTKNNRNFI